MCWLKALERIYCSEDVAFLRWLTQPLYPMALLASLLETKHFELQSTQNFYTITVITNINILSNIIFIQY